MTQPAKEQIARFLACFEALGKFEAASQMVRGYGAFNDKDWPEKPDPAVMAVKDWLTELADKTTSCPLCHLEVGHLVGCPNVGPE